MRADEKLYVQQVFLTALRVAVQHRLPEEYLGVVANLEIKAEWLAGDLVASLMSRLVEGEEFPEASEHIDIPADWWQGVRERWLPAWWLKRYPVQTECIVTRTGVRSNCPHIAPEKPEMCFSWLANGETGAYR